MTAVVVVVTRRRQSTASARRKGCGRGAFDAVAGRRRVRHIGAVPDLSIHLIPFLEIVASIVAVPVVGYFAWRGVGRRRRDTLPQRDDTPPRLH